MSNMSCLEFFGHATSKRLAISALALAETEATDNRNVRIINEGCSNLSVPGTRISHKFVPRYQKGAEIWDNYILNLGIVKT